MAFRNPVHTLPASAITGWAGTVITGATIRTGTSTTYPRIELSPDGNLYFYPAAGMDPAVVKVDGEAGALQLVGPDSAGVEYGLTIQKAFGATSTTIDTDETNILGRLSAANFQTGGFDATFAAAASRLVGVSFPTPYPAGVVPTVITNIASAPGTTARWDSRAINITNTGFQVFLFKGDLADPDTAWSNVPVQWLAFG